MAGDKDNAASDSKSKVQFKTQIVAKGKLDLLLNERSSIRKKCDKLLLLMREAETKPTGLEKVQNCLLRCENVHDLLKSFQLVHREIVNLKLNENISVEEEDEVSDEFDDLYYSIKSRERDLVALVNKLSEKSAISHNLYSNVKLPRVELPVFSGDLGEYQSFMELFVSLIHRNSDLSDIEKFHYLTLSLRDEPQSLIKSLKLSASNYRVALDLLNKRYSNKRIIANHYVQAMNNIRPISERSAKSLKYVVDNFSENLSAFKALITDADAQIDFVLVNLLLHKLDIETRERFELSIADSDELPSLQSLVDFVDSHCRALESVDGSCSKNKSIRKDFYSKSKLKVSTPVALVVNRNTLKCVLCKQEHELHHCSSFLSKTPFERFKIVKSSHYCINCLSQSHLIKDCRSAFTCKKCRNKHHTLLHFSKAKHVPEVIDVVEPVMTVNTVQSEQPGPSTVLANMPSFTSTVLLSTVVLQVADNSGAFQPVRAVLDSGSQLSFISESCMQRLGIPRVHFSMAINGLNQSPSVVSKGISTCVVKSRCSPSTFTVDAVVIPSVCCDMPSVNLDPSGWSHLTNLTLGDPYYYKKQPVEMLLGCEVLPHILLGNVIRGRSSDEPLAVSTIFGYVLMGKVSCPSPERGHSSSLFVETSLAEILHQFWELENVPDLDKKYDEDYCERHFRSTHFRDAHGRYVVSLPFKDSKPCLGKSRAIALRRFHVMEKSFDRDSNVRDQYMQFMQNYLDSGHMEKIPVSEPVPDDAYYIPQHCVFKDGKIRVVFDASCKSSNGVSLNDTLHIGPKLQQDISTLLTRFRFHAYVLVGDIKQMYRQILVRPEDRDYQRILFRFDSSDPVEDYRLNTVTYGLAPAPFLALRAILQLAIDEKETYACAAKVLARDVYVDDVLTGACSMEAVVKLQQDLSSLAALGGFPLRKWVSNAPEILSSVPVDQLQDIMFDSETRSTIKVLGLRWSPYSDRFTYSVQPRPDVFTKRTMLSELARIFDPLGFLAPVTMFCKSLIQHLWTIGLGWDDPLPSAIHSRWMQYARELPMLSKISVERYVLVDKPDYSFEFHAFCDASQTGYAAVIYLKVISNTQEIQTFLIVSKSKLAPLKRVSVPRLELCAALLLSRLLHTVLGTFRLLISTYKVFAWTDSTVVLHWLSSSPHRWKIFVANRVAQIQEVIPSHCWFYVPSLSNPADCASRGILPSQLVGHSLWWFGPPWLELSRDSWPSQPPSLGGPPQEVVSEVASNTLMVVSEDSFLSLLDRYSSLLRLLRVTCWCLRFAENCRGIRSRSTVFTRVELHRSLVVWIRLVQQELFSSDIKQLAQQRLCSKPLRKLNPFLDENSILRVGGRLKNSSLPFEEKHPILLPRQHRLTTLLIEHYHKIYLHPGFNTLHSLLRRQFWILSPRRALRHVLSKCHTCFRVKPTISCPPMGDLPASRISQAKAFKFTGVDFGGPFTITMNKVRGAKTLKAYLCLFVCFTTKAVHLELASDLSTEAFLAAFRRFISRRGQCVRIHSDCGTNFIGANREIMKCMQSAVERENFVWNFNVPSGPHMGGLWEAGIKSVKGHLVRIVGEQILTFEELSTVFVQIEAILNSRPLCSLSSDPNDLQALTPNHFLNLEPLGSFIAEDYSDLPLNRLSRWQRILALQQTFWRRWSREYLHTLQQRNKWTEPCDNFTVGTLVVIKDDVTPPLRWRLGRVIEVHPGHDGVIRIATVHTANGTYRRPIVKLCRLPNQ